MSGVKARPTKLRIALLQLNPTVGDLTGNLDRIKKALRWAEEQRADIALTPELALTGYPPEDLLLRPQFLSNASHALKQLSAHTASTLLVCGHPVAVDPRSFAARSSAGLPMAHNSASALQSGKTLAAYHKITLPNYGVFDEIRHFIPGNRPVVLRSSSGGRPLQIALSICEDLWPNGLETYLKSLDGVRPDIILNLSASPYEMQKPSARTRVLSLAARRTGAHVVYLNLVGGQDELVFDGRSMVLDPRGRVLARGAAFEEDLFCVDLSLTAPSSRRSKAVGRRLPGLTMVDFSVRGDSGTPRPPVKRAVKRRDPLAGSPEDILAALELSVQDYVRKNGFTSVGVAMSGGIDSALVAALAARALGPQRVIGVTLPSAITSRETLSDAGAQARTMGIRFYQIPIAELQKQFLRSLTSVTGGKLVSAAEENLQARIRGTLMMALSNHMNFLLLATGNKSELATGYCTLYGDMAGGFAPIRDLTKTRVYEVARALNRLEGRQMIPTSVLRRAPTAELKPGQKDQDTLPPYPVLDAILELLVEKSASVETLQKTGRFKDKDLIDTARRVYFNEYKRRQAPPGPKITSKAFGRDRRMPISQIGGSNF